MVNNNLNEYKNWLIKRNLTLNTVRSYLWAMREYGKRELSVDAVISFFKDNLKKYEPASLKLQRHALISYSKFQKKEVEWETITRVIPAVQRKFFTTINEKELELLKQTTISIRTNQRSGLMLDFLFYTGIRVNELINIRHCDYQNKSLRIKGKGNKVRFIPIPDFLVKCFNSSQDYLFATRNNRKLEPTQIRIMIYQKTKKAGIDKHISPHTFRRSFATHLNNRNCKLTTIQKILGHSNIETTSNYIHNSYEEIYADYSKLWISSPPPPISINSFKKN